MSGTSRQEKECVGQRVDDDYRGGGKEDEDSDEEAGDDSNGCNTVVWRIS